MKFRPIVDFGAKVIDLDEVFSVYPSVLQPSGQNVVLARIKGTGETITLIQVASQMHAEEVTDIVKDAMRGDISRVKADELIAEYL